MTISDQILQLEKERDYYKSLCERNGLLKKSQFGANSVNRYITLPEAKALFSQKNYLELSDRWLKTCSRVWDEFMIDKPEAMTLDQVRRKDVSDFILGKNNILSRSSRNVYLSALKNVFRVMKEFYSEEVVSPANDPTAGIKINMTEEEKNGQQDNKELFLRNQDFEVWRSFPFAGEKEYIRNISLLQCHTGMSVEEIKAFSPEAHIITSISGDKKIRIRRKKTKNSSGSYSEIVLFPEAERLTEYFKANRGGLSDFISVPTSYYYWLKELSTEAGISRQMTPHGGRHTFGYLMLMKGFSMAAISAMMGHSSINTTERIYATVEYDHILKEYQELKNKVL